VTAPPVDDTTPVAVSVAVFVGVAAVPVPRWDATGATVATVTS
jgi:hypothetical protein